MHEYQVEAIAFSIVRDIKRKTRRKYAAEKKIWIVLEGLRGEHSITDLCRKEEIMSIGTEK